LRNFLAISDRIIFLKSVSLFTDIPDPYLTELSDRLEEEEVGAGRPIFEKGDAGSCMYMIIDGRVRVHDGERTLNELGKRDVFGEMAALDPELRSLSVTAMEPTRLYRLDRQPLFELMADHTEVALQIIHILSQRLRARVKDMAEDYKYMRQFARVTAAAVAVEGGIYEPESLDEVAARTDELGQLARVFQRMVGEVYNREQRLKQEVSELRIEIDEVKKARQVAEITETQYFQDLKNKALQLRASHREGDQEPSDG
jgi:CRP/FNR family transcriptional regulator, cyclic AMP receptor protein